jgi:hypothetical protein
MGERNPSQDPFGGWPGHRRAKRKIKAIQNATGESVEAIRSVGRTIGRTSAKIRAA